MKETDNYEIRSYAKGDVWRWERGTRVTGSRRVKEGAGQGFRPTAATEILSVRSDPPIPLPPSAEKWVTTTEKGHTFTVAYPVATAASGTATGRVHGT